MLRARQGKEALNNMWMIRFVHEGIKMFESLKVMLDQELDNFFCHVTLVRGIRNSEYL